MSTQAILCERHPEREAYRLGLCKDCFSGKASSKAEEVGSGYTGRAWPPKVKGFKTIQKADIKPTLTRCFGVDDVLEAVAGAYHIPVQDVTEESNSPYHVIPRAVAVYVIRRCLKLSYPVIGKRLGLHHSTVLYQYGEVQKKMRSNEEYRKLVLALVERFEFKKEQEDEDN